MNDHEDGNGRRHEDEVVNNEGVLPHNRPDDDDDNEEKEEEEEGSSENEEEVEDDDDDDDDDDDEESVVPTADEVELEYTFPDDFPDRSFDAWRTVVRRFFRLIIDPSCTEIPDHVFRMCTLLIEIVFPDNSCLTQIGRQSFHGCHNLQRMNAFPEGMIEFEEYAFSGCRSLGDEITIPRNVRYLRDHCFYHCKSLTSVVFDTDQTTTTAAASAVANPNSVVELGVCVFSCCDELRSVRLPYNVIEIPPFCFEHCSKLTNVPIPVPVRVIREYAFWGCSSLISVYLSENVDAIYFRTFDACTSLKCITIRSSNIQFEASNVQLDEVGSNVHLDEVFTNCPALSSIKVFPTVWPKLFENHESDPNFIYKFLREYQYQIERLIEWKKNPQVMDMRMSSTSSSSVSALSTQNDNPIRKDERKGETKRPRL